MKVTAMYLSNGVKGRPGTKIAPKALVIHWTANTNKGANAVANRNYFNSGVAASAHYIVDDKQIVQCLPEDEMAYHVGAKKYTAKALQELSAYPNNTTIGIEMCVNSDGNFQKTYQNTVELAADILKRHNWNVDKLWRHYDITGKDCPKFFVDDATALKYGFTSAADGWQKFKNDVKDILIGGKNMTDYDKHWAKDAIEFCMDKGIFVKTDKFRPDGPITRAEVATVMQRLVNLLDGGKK